MDTTKLLEELYGEPVKWDIAYAGCEKVATLILQLWLNEVDDQKKIDAYIEVLKEWNEAENLCALTGKSIFDIFSEIAGHYDLKTFSGRTWSNLLIIQPQYVEHCDWHKFTDQDWDNLLSHRPQFINKCNHSENLNGHTWSVILQYYPELADKCYKWSKFAANDWIKLLQIQPQFAELYNEWDHLCGREWIELLAKQPQLADKCNQWEKFTNVDWDYLLSEQPQLADKCNQWEKFTNVDWDYLLSKQPQLADKCNQWEKFTNVDWDYLLSKQPQLADKYLRGQPQVVNERQWKEIMHKKWEWLQPEQPQFSNEYDLDNHSERGDTDQTIVDECDLKHLSSYDWLELLENSPEYQNKCYCYHWSEDHLKILLKKFPDFDLNRLDSYSWASLCRISPEFADRCKWETFTGHDWSYLLQKQPQFADKCNWAKLNRKDWFALIEQQPQFGERFPIFYSLTHNEWIDILCNYPKLDCWFSKVMNQKFQDNSLLDCWATLSGDEWCRLLLKQPYFFRYCKWRKLKLDNWNELLERHPAFICKYRFRLSCEMLSSFILSGDTFAVLFADYALSKRKLNYTKDEWMELLTYLPFPSLIAKQCPWEEFTPEDWPYLYSQYADWYDITKQKANE